MSNNEKLNVNQSSKVDEAVIIYRSWFICLFALGPIKFGKAMIALLSYAFFGADIHTFGLSPQVESILYTFTPVIESNRRKVRHTVTSEDDLETPQGFRWKPQMEQGI